MGRTARTAARGKAVIGGLAAALLVALASPVPAVAGTARPEPTVTAFQVKPLNPTSPVVGSDGLVHLAYELEIDVLFPKVVTFESIEVLDPADGDAIIGTVDAATLATTLKVFGGETSATIPAGGGGIVFMDVILPRDAAVPRLIEHHFSYSLSDAVPVEDPPGISDTAAAGVAPPLEFIGAPQRVSSRAAIVVAPPLRGNHWVVGNGCCATITAHRGATLPIDGTIHVPERYAIDFVQLDDEDKLFAGPLDENESYAYYDDDILSVAPGKVVAIQDGLPDQVPGQLDPNATVQTAGGNYVVVDIGNGHFAFYAHMIPESITVEKGDQVTTGQVLGKLGNSGNTDGAHLHFHIMDGPSPLLSNGLPFEFTRFTGEGKVVSSVVDLQAGAAAQIDGTNLGRHRRQLPLDLEVIGFGSK